MTPTTTLCTSIDCRRPGTHYARRFGPGSPFCYACACWADGFSPSQVKADPRLEPERLGKTSTCQPPVVTLG